MNKAILEDNIKRIWGNNCFAYEILNQPRLSINHEVMPHGTHETKHYHTAKNQFFYCLEGVLSIEIEEATILLNRYEGFYVKANISHKAKNLHEAQTVFLVISDNNIADRITVD